MDVKDVSDVGQYSALLAQITNATEQAKLRKGQKPRDLRSRTSLVSDFMSKRDQRVQVMSENPARHMISTSQVPYPYPPSVRLVDDLQPIMISQMRLEEHHRGKKVLLRVITPSDRITAVMAIAEDEEGTVMMIQLYNQPEEEDVKHEEIVKPQSVCVIKEPFLKCTTDGFYGLRVDHVSDIVWLPDDDDRVPPRWRKPIHESNGDSTQIRTLGNSAVKAANWAGAEHWYSLAIRAATTPEQRQLAHLNRSFANLKLGRPEKALQDALKGRQDGSPSEKALFREAKALYALGQFKSCLDRLQTLITSYPGNHEARQEIERVQERIQEQETGVYRFRRMHNQAKATPPIIDCATYVGPVAVRASPGCGRGLFTTKPVKVGDLLFCEKAFAYTYAGDDDPAGLRAQRVLMNLSTKRVTMGGQAHLITQTVQKLYHNPQMAETFKSLHHGDYDAVSVSAADGAPIVDSFLVERIINLNCFGCPRSSLGNIAEKDGAESKAHTTCGIWPLASHINHSCVHNCSRSFIGDVQIVRASRDLEADTELRFEYRSPPAHESYAETQKRFKHWGFTCDCVSCRDRKSTSTHTRNNRRSLTIDFKAIMNGPMSASKIQRAQAVLKRLESTFSVKEGSEYLEACDKYFLMGQVLLQQHDALEGLEMIISGLEAYGFELTACPPRKDSSRPKLEVRRWGFLSNQTTFAFLRMSEIYGIHAPELSATARRYAEISHSVFVGESDSLSDIAELSNQDAAKFSRGR
ncbi:TPR domain protein [Durotheca rogersii]|uniref:TPR domain protein n=1 Tax=Durotheca rogersii TaxID=419775 RepID=UPI00221F8CDC|nr:TPR domain protein [Durotheca rogersii]KAI5860073.1 TPR domain protein [Durotheca rogersii]